MLRVNLLISVPFVFGDLASTVTAVGTALTSAAALAALVYARKQISSARQQAKQVLAYELYERQSDPSLAKYIAVTAEYLTIDEGDPKKCCEIEEQRWKRWQRMTRAERGEILLYPNHLEVVAGLYLLERLDKDATMLLFGLAGNTYWKRGSWFIQRLREEYPRTYSDWEKLSKAYERHRPTKGEVTQHNEGLGRDQTAATRFQRFQRWLHQPFFENM